MVTLPSTPLHVVVFSKDRPLQVDATVRSLLATCTDPDRLAVQVLYLASTERSRARYERLAGDLSSVSFVPEQGFRDSLLRLLPGDGLVAFVVDDALFVRSWSVASVAESLERRPDAIGFSLRLGRNTVYCYMLDAPQRPPAFEESGDALAFRWPGAEHDFGYPLELSSSVYRAAEIGPVVARLAFRNPNDLESRLDETKLAFSESRPTLLCYPATVAFCAPVNVVQTTHRTNRSGARADQSPEALDRAFDEGRRIDVAALRGLTPRAVHEEITLPLSPRRPPAASASGPDLGRPAAGPTVSVVIPCYRQAALLPFAVSSVALQTLRDWEIVVVDDGSPDDTAEVTERLASRLPAGRLRLLRQANAGAPAARNAGIAASRGRYVLPLDADDAIDPSFLEKTVAALEADPAASIAFTDVVLFGGRSGVWRMGPFDLESLRERNRLCCTSLLRRDAWETIGGFRPEMTSGYEDWDFWIACAARGLRAVHVAEPLFFYRQGAEGTNATALRHHDQLRARIVVDRPEAFSRAERAAAERLLAAWPLPRRGEDARVPEGPAVSVVIPCFRQAEFLPFAVSSVARQTFTDWEIVVVDDGSPDDTFAVARRLAKALPPGRLRVVRQANAGLSAARNAGIRSARGRYILPLDADDGIDAGYLAATVTHLERYVGFAVVTTDGVTFGARQELLRPIAPAGPHRIKYANSLNYCSLYRRAVWDAVGGYNPNMTMGYEDWDFWVGVTEAGFQVAHLPEPLFLYRVREESMFTRARRHDGQLRARIVLNHPDLFSAAERSAAETALATHPLPLHPSAMAAAGLPPLPDSRAAARGR